MKFSWNATGLFGLMALLAADSIAAQQTGKTPAASSRAGQSSSVENSQSGILYGKDYAFTLSAPKGWKLDDAAGRAQGVVAVFYRHGESWSSGPAVMYANVAYKVKGQDDTFQKVVQYDLRQSRIHRPGIQVTAAAPLATGDGRKAVAYLFTHAPGAAKEKAVYIDTPKVVVMLVLTAKTDAAYDGAVADFTRLVRSFAFISSDVEIKTGAKSPSKKKLHKP